MASIEHWENKDGSNSTHASQLSANLGKGQEFAEAGYGVGKLFWGLNPEMLGSISDVFKAKGDVGLAKSITCQIYDEMKTLFRCLQGLGTDSGVSEWLFDTPVTEILNSNEESYITKEVLVHKKGLNENIIKKLITGEAVALQATFMVNRVEYSVLTGAVHIPVTNPSDETTDINQIICPGQAFFAHGNLWHNVQFLREQ